MLRRGAVVAVFAVIAVAGCGTPRPDLHEAVIEAPPTRPRTTTTAPVETALAETTTAGHELGWMLPSHLPEGTSITSGFVRIGTGEPELVITKSDLPVSSVQASMHTACDAAGEDVSVGALPGVRVAAADAGDGVQIWWRSGPWCLQLRLWDSPDGETALQLATAVSIDGAGSLSFSGFDGYSAGTAFSPGAGSWGLSIDDDEFGVAAFPGNAATLTEIDAMGNDIDDHPAIEPAEVRGVSGEIVRSAAAVTTDLSWVEHGYVLSVGANDVGAPIEAELHRIAEGLELVDEATWQAAVPDLSVEVTAQAETWTLLADYSDGQWCGELSGPEVDGGHPCDNTDADALQFDAIWFEQFNAFEDVNVLQDDVSYSVGLTRLPAVAYEVRDAATGAVLLRADTIVLDPPDWRAFVVEWKLPDPAPAGVDLVLIDAAGAVLVQRTIDVTAPPSDETTS